MKKWINFKKYDLALFATSLAILMLGLSYIAVPLYQLFCQTYGLGVNSSLGAKHTDVGALRAPNKQNISSAASAGLESGIKKDPMDKNRGYGMGSSSLLLDSKPLVGDSSVLASIKTSQVDNLKPITVYLSADNAKDLPWILKPSIPKIKVYPGDTALTFYFAQNLSNESITGVATYNIVPAKAGIYFNKIQCFCFEEQRLKGNECVELPVLFFIDSDFLNDPKMKDIDSITLSYTFFKTTDLIS